MGNRPKGTSLLQLVRRQCMECLCDRPREIERCTAIKCALYAYRLGEYPEGDR